MQSSESTSDSDSSASKKTTVSVEQIYEDKTKLEINHETITTTTPATSTTETTSNYLPPSTSPPKTDPTTTINATETPATNTTSPDPADRGDIGSYIDDLIRKNEAIVENCPLTNIRPYKQSAPKVGDSETITTTNTSGFGFNIRMSDNATTLSQITRANNPAIQRNLSTASSSSSSSSSTNPNQGSQEQQQAKQTSISHPISNIHDITTTIAPTKRKSTPCLMAPTNLSNIINQFSSHVNQTQNSSSAAAAAAAYGLMQKAANLRSISEHRNPQESSLFINNINDNNNSNNKNNNTSNINWPTTNGIDYPSDSTGYSSAGSLSHQSSICDTTLFSNATQTNLVPTSISAYIAQSLPSLTAAISAAASASIETPSSLISLSTTTTTTTTTTTNNNHHHQINNHAQQLKTTSSSSPFNNQSGEPRSRKRSYEVRNKDYFYNNLINNQHKLPSSSSSNRFSSNMFVSMAPSTSSTNASNSSQLFNFSQILDEQSRNLAIQQQQTLDTDSTEFKMALIREKMAELSRQQDSLQLELEEQKRKHEQQQHQHHQNHISNLSAFVNNDNQYLEQLRQQFLKCQLPTTEHSAELLTQSLDSATPAYKCLLCNMSFWTKALLNYHHETQCPSIINLLGLNLAHQQQDQSQLKNNSSEILSLHQQLQQLEMTADLTNGSVSPNRHQHPTLSKSASPTRVKSQIQRPDFSILNANILQQHQIQNSYPTSTFRNHHNGAHLLRQPSIKIDQVDNDHGSNEILNRSLSPIARSFSTNRNRNNSDIARRCNEDHMEVMLNDPAIINVTSTLTPTTSSSSNLSLSSDTSCNHQLRPNSASMTTTINNGALIGASNNGNNNNLGTINSLPLKKRKISAPGFI